MNGLYILFALLFIMQMITLFSLMLRASEHDTMIYKITEIQKKLEGETNHENGNQTHD